MSRIIVKPIPHAVPDSLWEQYKIETLHEKTKGVLEAWDAAKAKTEKPDETQSK